MNHREILTSLTNSRVIRETKDGGFFQLTEGFKETLNYERRAIETLADETLRDMLMEAINHEMFVRSLITAPDNYGNMIVILCALAKFDVDIPLSERLRVVVILDQLNRGFPPSSGAPANFMPVYGDQLQHLLSATVRGVVFVWRDDCSPCETMRGEFEQIFADPPERFHLFAVYGPESAALLQRKYNVVGGPTTLFVLDGRVDARLQGAHHRETIENEIQLLKEHS